MVIPPLKPERAQMFDDHRGRRAGVAFQQLVNGGFESIQFARPIAACGRRSRGLDVLRYGAAADMEVSRDLAQRPLINQVQTVNGVDLIRREHWRDSLYPAETLRALEGCCLQAEAGPGVRAETLREPRAAPEPRCCLQAGAARCQAAKS